MSSNLRLYVLLGVLAAATTASLLWNTTSLGQWMDLQRAVQLLQKNGRELGPLVAILLLSTALILAVPLTFLTVVTLVAFGPVIGIGSILMAATLGGATSYWLGRWIGRDALAKLAGPRLDRINDRLSQRGTLAVALIRLVPIAPFCMVNMVIGLSRISFVQFLFGNLIGMLPGAVIMAIFVDRLVKQLSEPSADFGVQVVFVAGGVALALVVLRRLTSISVRTERDNLSK